MIGEMKVYVAGIEYTIRADWRTGQLISERVADPFTVMMEFAKVQYMAELGQEYAPKFELGFTNSVLIIHAGIEGSGGTISLDDVGNYFVGERLPDAINFALGLISLFGASADEIDSEEADGEPEKMDPDGTPS